MKKLTRIITLSATITAAAAAAVLAASRAPELQATENTSTAGAATPNTPEPENAALTFTTAGQVQSARYQVQEQLVGFDLPNQAIGRTSAVTGAIALDSAGHPLPNASTITIDVKGLKSDKDRRDRYVRGRILEVAEYPTVTFQATSIGGLPNPVPTSGSKLLTLNGNLTVHGVTRPTTWQVNATFLPNRVSGVASTSFTFAKFGLTRPRVPVVLSVDDKIELVYDFVLVRLT